MTDVPLTVDQSRMDMTPDGEGCHPLFRTAPSSVRFKKLRKRLIRSVRQALDDFAMVHPGQKWLVCLSGGKDSYGLLALLMDLQWRGLLPVELLVANLDQGQPGFPAHILPEFLDRYQIPHCIERKDTYAIVVDKIPESKTYCSLCSRLRRGHLYRIAREQGCDAVVLGHHRDDILETFFLNLFHGGRMLTMPPKLMNEEGDLTVLRPLAYATEADLTTFAADMAFPIIPCSLCGSQDGLQRQEIKAMLRAWEKEHPGRAQSIFRALGHVSPSHLLDRNLFPFSALGMQATEGSDDSTLGEQDICAATLSFVGKM